MDAGGFSQVNALLGQSKPFLAVRFAQSQKGVGLPVGSLPLLPLLSWVLSPRLPVPSSRLILLWCPSGQGGSRPSQATQGQTPPQTATRCSTHTTNLWSATSLQTLRERLFATWKTTQRHKAAGTPVSLPSMEGEEDEKREAGWGK